MVQPIKQAVLEKHPDAEKKEILTVLIDGNSLLRMSFRDNKINTMGIHYGAVFQFLLQLRMMLQKTDGRVDYIYVFFDAHDSGILRYEIYPDYKANRDKDYIAHSSETSDYMKEYNARIAQTKNGFYHQLSLR